MYANHTQESTIEPAVMLDDSPKTSNLTAKITTYLRWVGTLLIILSAISFMLQGNIDILPAYRYWIGLGLTLLLCSGGLICAYLFHETKGARIFFGLGAAFIPVQVSQVAAMIYASVYRSDALQPEYSWLQFSQVSPVIIGVDLIITGLLLLLVSYASYSILARKHLKTLIIASVIGNIALLLPIRDQSLVPLVIAGLYFFSRKIECFLHSDTSMRLAEGMAARAIISLPLWIMMGRSLLHPVSFLLAVVFSSILAIYCIYDIKRYSKSDFILYIAQIIGTLAAILIWVAIVEEYINFKDLGLSSLLPIPAILFILSNQVNYHARLYRFISAVLTMGLSYYALMDEQAMAPVTTIAAGILLSIAGIKYREKVPFISGNICVTGGFLFYWEYAINLYSSAPWISSIGLGLTVILLASYIENREQQIMAKSRYYFKELKSWH